MLASVVKGKRRVRVFGCTDDAVALAEGAALVVRTSLVEGTECKV
jgi:hypothetical protein